MDLNIGFEIEFCSDYSATALKRLMDKELGFKCIIDSPPSKWRKGKRNIKWYIHDDTSVYTRHEGIKGNTYTDYEISGGIYNNSKDALITLRRLFKFMEYHEIETNSTTGLHVNIDIGKDTKKIRYGKLIALLDDKTLTKKYNRSSNEHCRETEIVIAYAVEELLYEEEYEDADKISKKDLYKFDKRIDLSEIVHNKDMAVNLHGSASKVKYLEFRFMGNKNYHKNFDKVKKDIYHIINCLKRSIDDRKGETIYRKRLQKIIGKRDFDKIFY